MCRTTASASEPAAPGSYRSPAVSPVSSPSIAVSIASARASTACRSPCLDPKWCTTRPGETPAAAAICRTVTASGPRSANSRSASSRITARVVRSSGAELMFNILNKCLALVQCACYFPTSTKLRHVPAQLFDVVAIPVVFTLMFTYLFGGALAGSPGRYLAFILPGTLVMAVLLVTMYAGIALNADIARGTADRFRALPVWRAAPIAGALLGDIARYLLAGTLVTVLGLAIGYRPARTSASNVFVAPRTMPGWLQAIVRVNPVSHLVTAERALLSGHAPAGQVAWVLIAAAIMTVVFAPLTAWLYGRPR
jgi:ABC-2 type transport system permease protein